jgi:hypothetical protein
MEVLSYTAGGALVRFEPSEIHLILAATRWVLERIGGGRYGRSEVHATVGLRMEDAEASLRKLGGIVADEPTELSTRDFTAARGFIREVVDRYLPLGIIVDDDQFEGLTGCRPDQARVLMSRLGDVLHAPT